MRFAANHFSGRNSQCARGVGAESAKPLPFHDSVAKIPADRENSFLSTDLERTNDAVPLPVP
jgi:hypothetical protein